MKEYPSNVIRIIKLDLDVVNVLVLGNGMAGFLRARLSRAVALGISGDGSSLSGAAGFGGSLDDLLALVALERIKELLMEFTPLLSKIIARKLVNHLFSQLSKGIMG